MRQAFLSPGLFVPAKALASVRNVIHNSRDQNAGPVKNPSRQMIGQGNDLDTALWMCKKPERAGIENEKRLHFTDKAEGRQREPGFRSWIF